MGELAGWMDENFVRTIFSSAMNENVQVKIIRDRHSGYVSVPSLCVFIMTGFILGQVFLICYIYFAVFTFQLIPMQQRRLLFC